MKLLRAVYMVKEMRLSSGFVEVLSHAPDLLDCQTPRFCNLLGLTLEIWSTRSCLRDVAYLLKSSPRITHLFLESKESNLADVGNDWDAGLPIPGMLSHLKFVQMEEVVGSDPELKLLSFLLKNANVLEKFALFFGSSAGSGDRVRQVKQFKNKLKLVPAASSSIRMVYKTSGDILSFTKTRSDTSQNIVVEDTMVVEVYKCILSSHFVCIHGSTLLHSCVYGVSMGELLVNSFIGSYVRRSIFFGLFSSSLVFLKFVFMFYEQLRQLKGFLAI